MQTILLQAFQIFCYTLAFLLPIVIFFFALWKVKEKDLAKGDLEVFIRDRTNHSVRTLLDVRGHLLSKKDKKAAEDFLKY